MSKYYYLFVFCCSYNSVCVLGEINELDERVLVARGGAGGGPVNSFNGQRAVSFHVRLNLKLIADVGLVG